MINVYIAESATEARDNFFKLLRMAAQGKEVFILKDHQKFQLTLVDGCHTKTKKAATLNKLANSGIRTSDWHKIESIIDSRDNE